MKRTATITITEISEDDKEAQLSLTLAFHPPLETDDKVPPCADYAFRMLKMVMGDKDTKVNSVTAVTKS